jgi:hypothetical protein
MRKIAIAAATAAAFWAGSTLAREPDKPITNRVPNAVDVAATPANDLNLRKKQIPAVLIAAQSQPYVIPGGCPAIGAAVSELNRVLGDDIDLARKPGRAIVPGSVAQSVIGSFIPFRGIIREVSGANNEQRALEAAIQAGIARRSFLKGYGLARGCRPPARPAA